MAAEAAARQGRFWDMHPLLMRAQPTLDRGRLTDYAEELGLDIEQFRSSLEDRRQRARIDRDLKSGTRSGVDRSPRFFLNGYWNEGPGIAAPVEHLLREPPPQDLGGQSK